MLKPPDVGIWRICLLLYISFLFKVIIIKKILIMAKFYWALDICHALL